MSSPTADEPGPKRSLRVVVADDHHLYRAALARMLERNGLIVVAQVADGNAAVRAVDETLPDIAVIDLNMPGLSGLLATRELAARTPPVPVLVVSVSAAESDVTDAILAGASGYLLKDRPQEEILAGIHAAAAGQSPISPRVAAMLVRRLRDADRVPPSRRFSPRPGPDEGHPRPGRAFRLPRRC